MRLNDVSIGIAIGVILNSLLRFLWTGWELWKDRRLKRGLSVPCFLFHDWEWTVFYDNASVGTWRLKCWRCRKWKVIGSHQDYLKWEKSFSGRRFVRKWRLNDAE